jgi:polysaccharide biosynthesis protein PelE
MLLSALALGLETACWYPFFCTVPPMAQQVWFLVLHAAGSTAGGAHMALVVPHRYRRRRWLTFFFFFGICLFIPSLGFAGLLLAVWPGIALERHQKQDLYRRVGVPELPFKPLNVQKQPIYGQAGMISVLRHAQDPERRIKALIATRQMTSQEAIPVLKEALRDPVDDVRLLAYSMLDAKEEEINASIRRLGIGLPGISPGGGPATRLGPVSRAPGTGIENRGRRAHPARPARPPAHASTALGRSGQGVRFRHGARHPGHRSGALSCGNRI